jgi:hypothetical protein
MVDETVQKVIPENCRRCENLASYITEGKRRETCQKGKPMREDCLWFVARAYFKRNRT